MENMEKPDVDVSTLTVGKIFQIDPIGKDPVQVKHGGDFLIAVDYHEDFVMGYLATVYDPGAMTRFKGRAYLTVTWKYLECIGSVFWYKAEKEEDEKGKD